MLSQATRIRIPRIESIVLKSSPVVAHLYSEYILILIDPSGCVNESCYIVENRFLRQAFYNSAAVRDVAVHHAPFAQTLQSKDSVNLDNSEGCTKSETCSSSIDELSNCHSA